MMTTGNGSVLQNRLKGDMPFWSKTAMDERIGRTDGLDGPGELARRREIQYEITPSDWLPAKSPREGDLGFTPFGGTLRPTSGRFQ